MRTTINLPDSLAEAAKERAAEQGITFTRLVEEGLRAVLASPPDAAAPDLPAYGDPKQRMLIDITDGNALWDALDADGPR